MNKELLLRKYQNKFEDTSLDSGVYAAPGRVNLIGEHTDYNDGFVMPMAIEKDIRMVMQLREDKKVNAYSLDYDKLIEFKIDNLFYDKENIWVNYIKGIIDELQKMGKKLQGFNLIFTGNIPQGSGLSSSAALEVVTALAISDLHKIDIEAVELALLAQRAENNFVNVQCGIMDQYISRLGKKDNALLIDCRTNEYLLVPFENEEYQIVICNSKVERGLVDSEYNKRRKECNQAVEFFAEKLDKNIKALRDLDLDTLHRYKEELSETVYKRAHHVISENKRVLAAKKALEANDMNNLGKLLYASHKSLSDDYEVSCDELDLLVDLASQQKGVKGARMTGAGFGGCTVNLVNKEYTADFVEKIKNKYYEKTNLKADIYITNPASGARKL
jgi:galactokinase